MTKLAKFPEHHLVEKPTIEQRYLKEYRNMSHHERVKKAALLASDNGRCWWVYQFIMLDLVRRNYD
jgi:hypothetical protein